MIRLSLAAAVAVALAAVAAPAATASDQRMTGPCASVNTLFEKYNIQIDMHQAEAEAAIRLACSHTG